MQLSVFGAALTGRAVVSAARPGVAVLLALGLLGTGCPAADCGDAEVSVDADGSLIPLEREHYLSDYDTENGIRVLVSRHGSLDEREMLTVRCNGSFADYRPVVEGGNVSPPEELDSSPPSIQVELLRAEEAEEAEWDLTLRCNQPDLVISIDLQFQSSAFACTYPDSYDRGFGDGGFSITW